MSSISEDADAIVYLTSSSQLPDSTPLTAVGVNCGSVSGWTLTDVQQHVFFLVWVCGIPVHVRYVAYLLQRSAVGRSHAATLLPPDDLVEVAQRDVLKHVYERGKSVNATLSAWPTTRAFTSLLPRLSFLVPLGIAEVPIAAMELSAERESDMSGVESCEAVLVTTDEAARTPVHREGNRVASELVGKMDGVNVALSTTTSTTTSLIRVVTVIPDAHFTNVAALSLYSAAEADASNETTPPRVPLPSSGSSAFPLPVDASWCSRAYWTAVSQANHCIDQFSEDQTPQHHSDTRSKNAAPSNDKSSRKPAFPPHMLLPASTALFANTLKERKRKRGNATPPLSASAPDAVVIVDAEDEDHKVPGRPIEPPLKHSGVVKAKDTNASGAKSAKMEESAVIIIDSDGE